MRPEELSKLRGARRGRGRRRARGRREAASVHLIIGGVAECAARRLRHLLRVLAPGGRSLGRRWRLPGWVGLGGLSLCPCPVCAGSQNAPPVGGAHLSRGYAPGAACLGRLWRLQGPGLGGWVWVGRGRLCWRLLDRQALDLLPDGVASSGVWVRGEALLLCLPVCALPGAQAGSPLAHIPLRLLATAYRCILISGMGCVGASSPASPSSGCSGGGWSPSHASPGVSSSSWGSSRSASTFH